MNDFIDWLLHTPEGGDFMDLCILGAMPRWEFDEVAESFGLNHKQASRAFDRAVEMQ